MNKNKITDRAYDLTVESFNNAILHIVRIPDEKYDDVCDKLWEKYRNELFGIFEVILITGDKIKNGNVL